MSSKSQSHPPRHNENQCCKRRRQTNYDRDGKGVPEMVLRIVHKEWDKREDGGEDSQHYWYNLVVVGLQVGAARTYGMGLADDVVLVHDVDGSVDDQATQQHECCQSTRTEWYSGKVER